MMGVKMTQIAIYVRSLGSYAPAVLYEWILLGRKQVSMQSNSQQETYILSYSKNDLADLS